MAHDAPGDERLSRSAEGSAARRADRGRAPVNEQNKGIYWLFVLPFFGAFLPWIYNTRDPELIGIPFFYWYQMAWVPLSVIITVFVYRQTRGDR